MNSNDVVTAPEAEKLIPSMSLLPGGREVLVRYIPKELQGGWILKAHGNHNPHPSVNGFVFPRTSVELIRANLPGLMGGESIYDTTVLVPVVFSMLVPKAQSKEREKEQHQAFAKMGISWNAVKGYYEASVAAYTPAHVQAMQTFAKPQPE